MEWKRAKDGFGHEIEVMTLEDGRYYTINPMGSDSGFRIFKDGTLYAQEATVELAKRAVAKMENLDFEIEAPVKPKAKKESKKVEEPKQNIIYDALIEEDE